MANLRAEKYKSEQSRECKKISNIALEEWLLNRVISFGNQDFNSTLKLLRNCLWETCEIQKTLSRLSKYFFLFCPIKFLDIIKNQFSALPVVSIIIFDRGHLKNTRRSYLREFQKFWIIHRVAAPSNEPIISTSCGSKRAKILALTFAACSAATQEVWDRECVSACYCRNLNARLLGHLLSIVAHFWQTPRASSNNTISMCWVHVPIGRKRISGTRRHWQAPNLIFHRSQGFVCQTFIAHDTKLYRRAAIKKQ